MPVRPGARPANSVSASAGWGEKRQRKSESMGMMLPAGTGTPKPKETRQVWFIGGPRDVPVYDRDDIKAGQTVTGPALIEEAASVTVLDAGYRLTMHTQGHMLIAAQE